jgi:serine/alanine adding enzyme
MQIEISRAQPKDWDTYVAAHPLATAYHRAAAVAIAERAFGLRTYFVTARSAGELVGVLPLVEQSSVLFGRYLVSVPYFTYGGLLAGNDAAAQALAAAAADLASERRADHVELRHSEPIDALGLPQRLDKVSMILSLPSTEAELSKQLGSKLRSQIKRAEREAPEIVWGGKEMLDEFYGVFSATMHQLGTPVYSRRFFDVVYDAMSDVCKVLVLRVNGRAQASAVIVRHGSRVEVPWAAASETAKRNALNMRMYWEMLRECIANGAAAFDFGRSTADSGTYKFKAQWGAKPMQLYWHYWLPQNAELPKLNHSNPKYARAAALWRRMPLWCANVIGPRISRYLP